MRLHIGGSLGDATSAVTDRGPRRPLTRWPGASTTCRLLDRLPDVAAVGHRREAASWRGTSVRALGRFSHLLVADKRQGQ